MKKTVVLSAMFVLVSFFIKAQNCYTGRNHITPVASSNPGFSPPPQNLPCTETGHQLEDTIYFTNYSFFGGQPIDSVRIDSIGNLPAGTCWNTNKPTNSFLAGENGVIYIHGLTTAAAGQYRLFIGGTAVVGAGGALVVGPDADLSQLAGLYYWIRIRCQGVNCTALDTVNGKTQAFIAYSSCPPPITASISPAGYDTICSGSSATLTAGAGTGYTYKWSNPSHSTTQSITVTTPGAYTVTVYSGPDSVVSAPTTVVVNTSTTASISLNGSATFCQGGSVQLTASAGTHYNWSNTSQTQTITASASGTYTVTITNASGCSATASQTITVNPKPNASVSPAGPIVHCNNQSQVLNATNGPTYQWLDNGLPISGQTSAAYTATASGNYAYVATLNGCSDTSNTVSVQITAGSLMPTITAPRTYVCPTGYDTLDAGAGYSSYAWSPGGATTRTIAINTPGSYTVTVSNGSCTGIATTLIGSEPATPTPAITPTGSLTQCAGGSVTLTSSAATGNVWSNNATTQAITVSIAGSYTVTDYGLCGAATSAPVTFTLNPQPNVTITAANTTICSGQSNLITASGANTYVWNNAQTSQSITVNPTASTTYTVTGTNTADGCTAAQSVNITVVSPPAAQSIIGNSTITPLQSYAYAVNSASGVTYTWAVQNGAIQNGQGTNSVNILWAAHGPYGITLVQSNGTCADTITLAIVATGVTTIAADNEWTVYPNPAHNFVTIHNANYSNTAVYSISLTNIIGQTVYSRQITKSDTEIDLSAIGARGVYFLTIYNGQNPVEVKKVVVE